METETEYELRIERSRAMMAAGMGLFHWLLELSYPTIHVLCDHEPGLICVNKKPSEIVQLDFDYSSLERKYFQWHFSQKKYFCLNHEETMLFFKCCHAAHFYLKKQNYNIGDRRIYINQLYYAIKKELTKAFHNKTITGKIR